jgi:HD superfamily phosphodiesterase
MPTPKELHDALIAAQAERAAAEAKIRSAADALVAELKDGDEFVLTEEAVPTVRKVGNEIHYRTIQPLPTGA